MVMRYYDENSDLQDRSPCAALRADLKMCLLESDCVKKQKKTPRECLKINDGSVPDHCYQLRTTFFECKRSLYVLKMQGSDFEAEGDIDQTLFVICAYPPSKLDNFIPVYYMD